MRAWISAALAVAMAAAAIAGGSCLYVRGQLLSRTPFAHRTVAALDRGPVRRVIARELVVQVIDRASPDLLAARPVLNSVVEGVVGTQEFRGIVRTLAGQAHRLLFERGGNVVFSIADAGAVVISALRTLAPTVAAKIPPSLDATLLDLRKQSFAVRTLRLADRVRLLGIVLPLLAVVLLLASVGVARRRRAAVTRCGLALAVAAIALWADLGLLRHSLLVNLFGAEELSDTDVREAAGALWDAYMGDLSTWMLGLAAFGAVLAGVSCGLLRPQTTGERLSRLRERLSPPRTRPVRLAVAAIALLAGSALLGRPKLGLDVLAVAAGVVLVAYGIGEVLSALGLEPAAELPTLRAGRAPIASVLASIAVLVGGAVIALAADGPRPSHVSTVARALTCNGYAQLCSKRLDQVVFAGTHNSMSAAESPGWLIANQERAIARQLDDGIRAFKISTHYGLGSSPGHITTDIDAEGQRLNRVSEKLDAQARAALQRFSGSVGFGKGAKGKPGVWLCHTLCELGATSMGSFLGTVERFLSRNPDEVLVFFDEDYVSELSLEEQFKRSGLFSHLAVLRPGQELPTLGAMIRSQHNIVVFTQEPVSGRYPWDMYAFGSWIQDTPLGAVKPAQFTCAPSRGQAKNPLLMMNDWADVFPPRRSPNIALLKRGFIVERARQCERERHKLPNLILTDFYNSGDLIGAVRELNGLGEQRPTPVVAVR